MRNDDGIFKACVPAILGMIPWNDGEDSGRFIPPDALGWPREAREDDTPLIRLTEEAIASIREMRPTIEEVWRQGEEGHGGVEISPTVTPPGADGIWLGRYSPMQPLGLIQLHRVRIGAFFWHLVLRLCQDGHAITAFQLCRLAEATLAKTYFHELFHHRSDLLRTLFGTRQQDPLAEEALAVAASRHCVKQPRWRWDWGFGDWNFRALQPSLWDDFLALAYNYSAPGYRDWENYLDEAFAKGLIRHCLHPAALRLMEGCAARAAIPRAIRKVFSIPFDLFVGGSPMPSMGHWQEFRGPEVTLEYAASGWVEIEIVT